MPAVHVAEQLLEIGHLLEAKEDIVVKHKEKIL